MHEDITIAGKAAYHSYPDDGEKHPGLIVLEEIWGVNAHIRSVADRFAAEGYNVLAPELLPPGLLEMLTPQIQKDLFDPEKRHEVQPKLREAMQPLHQPGFATDAIAALKACVDYLHADGPVAVLGFCFGGSYAFHLAANDGRIKAALPFYGQAPSEEEVPNIECPILAFYGDQDVALMETLPKLKEDMAAHGKDFEAVVYPGVGHAFFNDTNARAFDPASAQDAWDRTLGLLKRTLD
jgi:carboxymethylenebutenolidase